MVIFYAMKLLKTFTILILLAIISTTASAATYNLGYGSEVIRIEIPVNRDAAYIIPLGVGDKLIVNLEVIEGGPVDFYLSNKTAYEIYEASRSGYINFDSLYYIDDYSRTSTGSILYTYNSLIKNELVVIIDNTGYIGEMPSDSVTVHGSIIVEKNIWTLQNILVTIVLIILIVVFMLIFKYPKKKA